MKEKIKRKKNPKIGTKAKQTWAELSDDEYWERVDKIKAGMKKHWDALSPEERTKRLAHLAEARTKSSVKKAETNA